MSKTTGILFEAPDRSQGVTCVGIEQLSAMMGEAQAAPGKFGPVDMMQGNGAMSQLFTDEMDQAIAHANAAYQIVRHANRDKKCL